MRHTKETWYRVGFEEKGDGRTKEHGPWNGRGSIKGSLVAEDDFGLAVENSRIIFS
jgi:hypothetical protein